MGELGREKKMGLEVDGDGDWGSDGGGGVCSGLDVAGVRGRGGGRGGGT